MWHWILFLYFMMIDVMNGFHTEVSFALKHDLYCLSFDSWMMVDVWTYEVWCLCALVHYLLVGLELTFLFLNRFHYDILDMVKACFGYYQVWYALWITRNIRMCWCNDCLVATFVFVCRIIKLSVRTSLQGIYTHNEA